MFKSLLRKYVAHGPSFATGMIAGALVGAASHTVSRYAQMAVLHAKRISASEADKAAIDNALKALEASK